MRAGRLWGMGLAAFLLFGAVSRGQDSLNVTKVSEIDWQWGDALHVALSGDYAFLGCTNYNFVALNVIDPDSPFVAGNCQVADTIDDIALVDNYALLACDGADLRVVNISNPDSMAVVSDYQLFDTWFHGIDVLGNYALVAAEIWPNFDPEGKLIVFDVSDPEAPIGINFIYLVGYAGWDVVVEDQGAYAYVLCGYLNGGFFLNIIDVSDLPNLSLISCLEISDAWGAAAHDISFSGNYVFITDEAKIHIIDVSNVNQPVVVSEYVLSSIPGQGWDFQVIGSYGCVAAGSGGIRLVNILNPSSFSETGYYDTQGNSRGVFVSNSLAYVADYNYFGIYDVSASLPVAHEPEQIHPSSFALHSPHPNPFNSSAAISYRLPADSYVSLKVYDTAGRLVTTLVEGWRRMGEYRMIFDGSGLPSGIYLARLTAGDLEQTQKLVLLK